jgi:hypothetical protein
MTAFLRRDASILTISVAAAFVTRFFLLFVGRPAFVGWFNHSPYYWVQSRSIIENGDLAYGDMPLIFVLYALLAKGAMLVGAPLETAIIVASRLVMTVTPALIPIPVYFLAKSAAGRDGLDWPTKCLVFASGFLPLTFANMPENLQKNMMGLLLLACFLLVLLQWLRTGRITQFVLLLTALVTICFVHLGSALAALLLVSALSLDRLLRHSSLTDKVRIVLLAVAVGVVVAIGIITFDPASVDRVAGMVAGMFPEEPSHILLTFFAVTVWMGLMILLWHRIARWTTAKDEATATLARVITLWLGLLVMPLWPGGIGTRLLLFMPLGAAILLLLFLNMFRKARPLRYLAAAGTLVFCLMSIAEAVQLFMVYPDKTKIYWQLVAVADKYGLSADDLVITPYGANTIANWFLGTRGAILTAVRRDVPMHHARVFVLNTLERRAPVFAPGECLLSQSEDDRYWATRHDIPMGDDAAPDPDFDQFAFFRLEKLPETWVFNSEGNWVGWGDCQGAREITAQ